MVNLPDTPDWQGSNVIAGGVKPFSTYYQVPNSTTTLILAGTPGKTMVLYTVTFDLHDSTGTAAWLISSSGGMLINATLCIGPRTFTLNLGGLALPVSAGLAIQNPSPSVNMAVADGISALYVLQ